MANDDVLCAWCRKPLPPASATGRARRADAVTCSKRCRQAKQRFRICRADQAAAELPRRLAYADPPYPGLARRYYGCDEVDHELLIARLMTDFPDGWALSTSAEALPLVLPLCPSSTRVCVWLRGARGHVRPKKALNAWEPLLVYGGRPGAVSEGLQDVLQWHGRQHSHPDALVGMKPAAFCEWMFRLLGARRGDTLVDLYPGSGAVGRAWDLYVSPAAESDNLGTPM